MKSNKVFQIVIIILLVGCIEKQKAIAVLNCSKCSVELTEKNNFINKLILFSNDSSINKKEILIDNSETKTLNICNVLAENNIMKENINLISMEIREANKISNRLIIEYDNISLLKTDTTILIYESKQ